MIFNSQEVMMYMLVGFALGMFLMALIQWLDKEWADFEDGLKAIKKFLMGDKMTCKKTDCIYYDTTNCKNCLFNDDTDALKSKYKAAVVTFTCGEDGCEIKDEV